MTLRVLSQVDGELCGGSEQSLITKLHRRSMRIWEQGPFCIGCDPQGVQKRETNCLRLDAGSELIF